jgi:predicted lipoprotein
MFRRWALECAESHHWRLHLQVLPALLVATVPKHRRSWMLSIRRLAPAALGVTLLIAACQSGPQAAAPSSEQVVDAFVNQVVAPNHQQLVKQSRALSTVLDALATNPDAKHLDAARTAWQQLRNTWERGESWAFGPAETGGFDANLDDWPVNQKDLSTALASGAITPELFAKLTTSAKGFHGIEAVLYGAGGSRPAASQLSGAQLTYLSQAGADLATNAEGLAEAWRGAKGFGTTFKGNANDAVAEILQGMVGTLEEIAAEKLGASLESRKKTDLESFYSDNTRADILANVAGVQEALKRSGLLRLIASRDEQLASSLQQVLDKTQSHAQALPEHLNNALTNPTGRERIQAVISASDRSAALLKQAAQVVS